MKTFLKAAIAATMLAGVSATAEAQVWNNSWAADNSGSPYWDNTSTDGANCNIGDVVSGVAGTAGNTCANQHPAGWLPYTAGAVPYNLQNGSGGAQQWMFGAGTYTFNQAINSGGDITGNNGSSERSWGYFTKSGSTYTRVDMPFQAADAFSNTVTFTGAWGIWIDRAPGTGSYRYSDDNQCSWLGCYPYHAVFSSVATGLTTAGGVSTINAAVGNRFVVGMEDVNLIDGSDKDYNDVVVSFSRIDANVQAASVTTPEPSTYALMAAGLAAMGLVARRRRQGHVCLNV